MNNSPSASSIMPDSAGPLQDRFVLCCAAICGAGALGFLGWAALVPLDEGISASGTIVVENSRQVVQHLEGGIIAELHVREGDRVDSGQTMLVLQDVASLASRDQVVQSLAGLRASEIRLIALREEAIPDFTAISQLPLDVPTASAIVAEQTRLYQQTQASHDAEIAVLQARLDGARGRAVLKAEQAAATRRALAATRDQLTSTRNMFAQQMVRLDVVQGLEREVAQLEGDIARLESERTDAQTASRDLEGQIAQARAAFSQMLAENLVEVRSQLINAEDQLLAVQDVLDRSVLNAPLAGEILNLRYRNPGAVVAPGEPIMEIVPVGGGLVASVRIAPQDRSRVFQGQRVRAQIMAYKSWDAPRLEGEVISVSADLKKDVVTGADYYEVRVRIPDAALVAAGDLELLPGMPMTAFIFAGTRRTTLAYLFEPVTESLFRGLRTS